MRSLGLVQVLLLSAGLQGAPDLPRPAFEAMPAAAREPLAQAFEVAKRGPTDPAALGSYARLLHAWEQWEDAHTVYTRLQELEPARPDWWYLDAAVLSRTARHAEAAERLQKVIRVAPEMKVAQVRLADALFEAGRFAESRKAYTVLAADAATEPMGAFGLGRVAAVERRHEEAIKHFERALELFPQWGAAHYALAMSFRALGRRDEAVRALERHGRYGTQWPALDDPLTGSIAALRDDARGLLQRGVALAARGDLDGAIAAHEAALTADPAFTQARANLLSLYGQKKDWSRAEAHYRELVRRGEDLGDAHYDYGVVLGMQGKWEEAAAAYRRALEANPLHARASNNLGEALERQGRLDAASQAYQQAVDSQPSFRLARFNYARTLIAAGRTEEAISELEKIVEPRDAQTPRYLFALAAAHVRAGRREVGIKLATEARELAVAQGQTELVASIDRDLARLK
jgi:tetratricopeptide (TPR) repeat protein